MYDLQPIKYRLVEGSNSDMTMLIFYNFATQ